MLGEARDSLSIDLRRKFSAAIGCYLPIGPIANVRRRWDLTAASWGLAATMIIAGGTGCSTQDLPKVNANPPTVEVEAPTSTVNTSPSADITTAEPRCNARPSVAPSILCADLGIRIADGWQQQYSCEIVGKPTTVPKKLGGLLTPSNTQAHLWIGGAANTPSGAMHQLELARDADCHIRGLATLESQQIFPAPYNDGGMGITSTGAFFYARWPVNQIGIKPLQGDNITVLPLENLGVPRSASAVAFVPKDIPGAGRMKLVTYGGGSWFDVGFEQLPTSLFTISSVTHKLDLPGGPEGFAYVAAGNPGFERPGILLSEYTSGIVSAYDIDANGDPILESRREFITGLNGAEGAWIDPWSGDFLFSTYGGEDVIVVIHGLARPRLI